MDSFKKLRQELRGIGAEMKVAKKRLLNLVLKNNGVNFDLQTTKNQIAAIFSKTDMTGVAGMVSKFSKTLVKEKKGEFMVLAAYDAAEKRVIDAAEFKVIAALPSREVLLAQIAMMLTMPVKKLMIALNERSKQATN